MFTLTPSEALAIIYSGNSVQSSELDAYYFNGSFLICNGKVCHHSLPTTLYRILGTRGVH